MMYSIPHGQSLPTAILYEKARALASKSTPSGRAKGTNVSQRRPWSTEEEQVLMAGLDAVKGPHWSQILALYGSGGSISEALRDRTQVQLKDKARNLKLFFLKSGIEVPYYLGFVTGELKSRAPSHISPDPRFMDLPPDAHEAPNGARMIVDSLDTFGPATPTPTSAAGPKTPLPLPPSGDNNHAPAGPTTSSGSNNHQAPITRPPSNGTYASPYAAIPPPSRQQSQEQSQRQGHGPEGAVHGGAPLDGRFVGSGDSNGNENRNTNDSKNGDRNGHIDSAMRSYNSHSHPQTPEAASTPTPAPALTHEQARALASSAAGEPVSRSVTTLNGSGGTSESTRTMNGRDHERMETEQQQHRYQHQYPQVQYQGPQQREKVNGTADRYDPVSSASTAKGAGAGFRAINA